MTEPHHRWGDPVRFEPHQCANGCAQTERACRHCDVVKITVHPPEGFPWTEWRQGGPQFQLSFAPPCLRRAAEHAPSSVDCESLSSRAPAVNRVCPHESRNPQGGTRR